MFLYLNLWCSRELSQQHTNTAATVQHHNGYGRSSIMVWAGIKYNQKMKLMIVQGSLTGHVMLRWSNFMSICTGNFTRTTTHTHTLRVAVDFLRQQGVRALPWPVKSAHMSPIECKKNTTLHQGYKRKYVHEVLVNRLFKLAQEKSVVRWTDRLDMTIAVEWDMKQQIKQTNKHCIRLAEGFQGR